MVFWLVAAIGAGLGAFIFSPVGQQVLEGAALYIFLFHTDLGNVVLMGIYGLGFFGLQFFFIYVYFRIAMLVKNNILPFLRMQRRRIRE